MSIKTAAARRQASQGGVRVFFFVIAFLTAWSAWAGETQPDFGMSLVADRAQSLAKEPYQVPGPAAAADSAALPEEKWEKIAFLPEKMLWKDEELPFIVGFYHNGSVYNQPVLFDIIDQDVIQRIDPSSEMFAYPNAEVKEQADKAGVGFAGFFLRWRPEKEGEVAAEENGGDLLSFLGASYFRSRGKHARSGAYARGLAIDTALANGEEIPYFREFWLEKPLPGATSFSFYALLDSPRLTGAFHFTVSPGTSTIMEVESRLFLRAGASIPDKIGLAPLTSMFLHSETTGPQSGDYRPEVHSSDGLLLANGDGSWQWVPLGNPQRLLINQFVMLNPLGFGLMQRDNNFDHYQDLDARFDRHSSVWVEPVGEWGAGRVELVEIPGREVYHRNIVAFWVPDSLYAAKEPADPAAPASPAGPLISLSYRIHWMTTGACPHPLGRAVATRMQKNLSDNTVRFVIDFEGEQLNALHADTGLVSIVGIPEHFALVEKQLFKNEVTSGWRLVLVIRLPQKEGLLNSLFASQEMGCARFTAMLKQGENLPEPLTETWVFNLLP